jgi:hypothetical protein
MNPPGASPDIRLTKNNSVGVFKGLTDEGKRWLRANIGKETVIIQVDYIDELREDIEKDNLRVEY